jgi:hypothetical protein
MPFYFQSVDFNLNYYITLNVQSWNRPFNIGTRLQVGSWEKMCISQEGKGFFFSIKPRPPLGPISLLTEVRA